MFLLMSSTIHYIISLHKIPENIERINIPPTNFIELIIKIRDSVKKKNGKPILHMNKHTNAKLLTKSLANDIHVQMEFIIEFLRLFLH